jgi:hypothetical protein
MMQESDCVWRERLSWCVLPKQVDAPTTGAEADGPQVACRQTLETSGTLMLFPETSQEWVVDIQLSVDCRAPG